MTDMDSAAPAEATSTLDTVRNQFAKFYFAFLWLNVPIAGAAAWVFNPSFALLTVGMAVMLALVPTLLWTRTGTSALTRYMSSASIAGLVALILNACAGSAYQLDVHMYFFATLAVVAGWCDWRAVIVNAAVVAVHHLSLNFLYPIAVFPEGADFTRVVLHAVVVVVQTGFLVWMTYRLVAALDTADSAVESAEAAQGQAVALSQEQNQAHAAQEDRRHKIEALVQSFRSEVQDVLATVINNMDQMRTTAQSLTSIAEQTEGRTNTAASAVSEASSNVQTVASAAEELSASVTEISQKTVRTTEIVAGATDATRATNQKVAHLSEAAQKIGEVVNLIQDIAEQTNLLALNATIEAARAGEMGKGFAVVAQEVKNLANQTARATEEIASQIGAIQASTGESVEAIQAVTDTMEEVNSHTTDIAGAIEQQRSATSEISQNVHQAATGTDQVMEEVTAVLEAVKQTNQSADQMQKASNEVVDYAERLKTTVDRFLDEVAAA